jgi:integrase/recombinase XerC
MQQAGNAWIERRIRTGQISPATARNQRYILTDFAEFMGKRSPKQIGASDLERWRGSMNGKLSPGTIRLRWRLVYCLFEYLCDEGRVRRNPCRTIPTPKVPRAVHRNLRPDQATALHDACIDNRERLIVALGFQLGMRRSEIARCQVGDFDFVARSVKIVGKGGHERVVALTTESERAIKAYTLDHGLRAGHLVRDVVGQHGLTADRIGRLWEAVAYRAGVKTGGGDGVASHSARHTAGTDVAHKAGPIVARDFLGHANIATTNIYCGGVDLEEQREALESRTYRSAG